MLGDNDFVSLCSRFCVTGLSFDNKFTTAGSVDDSLNERLWSNLIKTKLRWKLLKSPRW